MSPYAIRRALLAAIAVSPLAAAQEAAPPPRQAEPARAAAPADPRVERLASALVGSWRASQRPVAGDPTDVWMHIAPVEIESLPGALYVEQASAADRMDQDPPGGPAYPYRQVILQPYIYKDKLRLRTLEFRAGESNGALAGLWLAPDVFPDLGLDDLIGTLDLEVTPEGDGFKGRTPYPYPTAEGGAVEMTSELEVRAGRLVTRDRGYGADGSVVWGQEGEATTWERADPGYRVQRDDDGLVIITYAQPPGDTAEVGDTLNIEYALWLADGRPVDSSRRAGRLMPVTLPASLIAGFNRGIEGVTAGTIRRLVVPAALGYGPRPAGAIPPNSDLYFFVRIDAIVKAESEPEADEAPEREAPPTRSPEGGRGEPERPRGGETDPR